MPPSNPYEIPIVDFIGPVEIAGFFQNIYAVLTPAMPFLMISVATALAGYLIVVIRDVFTFRNMRKDNYGYKENEEND